jgi:hypothetical protein
MQNLRRLHLYLGCFFAPLLVFFALSGAWQAFGARSGSLALLSSLHTGRSLKVGDLTTLSSAPFRVLGLVMAFRFGHARAAFWSLVAGTVLPATLVVVILVRAAGAAD